MNRTNELSKLTAEYQSIRRRFEQLKNETLPNNLATRIAFEQCIPALDEARHVVEHHLESWRGTDIPEEQAYYRRAVRQALSNFDSLLDDTEQKVRNAKPTPPFLF
ncbi:MAG: hypothetical protein ACU84J_00505 [Gammaproteobacteria bacterium]